MEQELLQKLMAVVRTLETVEVKATESNLNAMLASVRTLKEIISGKEEE